jgi:hypothetical protein
MSSGTHSGASGGLFGPITGLSARSLWRDRYLGTSRYLGGSIARSITVGVHTGLPGPTFGVLDHLGHDVQQVREAPLRQRELGVRVPAVSSKLV